MNNKYFTTRRSCRNFKPIKIGEEKLKEIVEKAMKAPTCGNMQLYSIIVTQDEKNIKQLSNYHYNQPASITAPIILTICADFNRFTHWCNINDADAGYNNFHSFLTAMTDAVIFSQQIVTIAEQEGFGTCYLGTVNYNAKEISELLELPELVVPVVSIAIGVPEKEGEFTERLPLIAVLHNEKYKKYTDDEIRRFFKIHDENQENYKFIKENGKQNLAQVFAEVRYPKQENENLSVKFKKLLAEKGFEKEV